jgi:predicted ATP-dependent endonuclease of OLD family
MKLKTVFFDAYKSLLTKELAINFDCIGFVGTNESGKSNILSAISILNGGKKLLPTDTPKMLKGKDPALRYLFKLDEKETKEFSNIIAEWKKEYTLIKTINIQDINIIYHVSFDKSKNQEIRYFSLEGIKLENDCLILSHQKVNDSYKLRSGDQFLSLSKALVIKQSNVTADEKWRDSFKEIESLSKQTESIQFEITSLKEKLNTALPTLSEANSDQEANKVPEGTIESKQLDSAFAVLVADNLREQISKNEKKLELLLGKKTDLESKIREFNITTLMNEAKAGISTIQEKISVLQIEQKANGEKMDALKAINPLADTQKAELKTLQEAEEKFRTQLIEHNLNQTVFENKISELTEPIHKKYTSNLSELNHHLKSSIQPFLNNLLPNVVFWEYSPNYILQSETLYSDLLSKKTLQDVSRPLVNVFRIGLEVQSLDELKAKIKEIQTDPNERSRSNRTINKKVNEFLKNAWQDYDQSINISLEYERIRVEIYDPKREEEASHYNMGERSQGCQTFLSFLFTIGAEAARGVLTNNILLLDEPETHLHPSGVRYMLQELIRISEKGNIVMYATHSIFLIDRNKFDRHIIVKKDRESTVFQPSNVGRIGYFMQEEVLYRTLDTRLDSDFSFANDCNFVFEGDGDVNLFQSFYEKVLSKDESRPFPLKSTSFHQGGKCSDIKKYFTQRPIQLGTKWIFILDKDAPATELKKFLEGRYKNYIYRDIFIFQYTNTKKHGDIIEFEDLLPLAFINKIYVEAGKAVNVVILEKDLTKHITAETTFEKYHEILIKTLIPVEKQDEFNVQFKSYLNESIKKDLQTTKNEETFKNNFSDYYLWVQDVIKNLRTPVK